ncbi:MAG: hypothetical protein RL227_697 [Pseudomonadota bacterium]
MNLPQCPTLLLGCLLGAAGSFAVAQSAAPVAAPAAAAAAKDGKEAKAEAEAAAMERARRLAANPMRVILEASRVRRRADAEPAPSPAPVVPAAASPVGAASPAPEMASRAVPAPPRDTPPPEPAAVISSDLAQARSAAASAPALDLAPVARAVASPALALVPMAELRPEIARPTLISKVDPDPPPRLLADLGANTVITVDLTIRPDGSVSQVGIVTPPAPNTRALGRHIVSALQQWRFAPLPGERVWRVDLVFRADE